MPAFCAVPDVVNSSTSPSSPSTLTMSPPGATGEICDTSVTNNSTGGGAGTGNTATTTTVGGPPGPVGPSGPVTPHSGITWAGLWSAGQAYQKDKPEIPRHADQVRHNNASYICIQDHISDENNRPELSSAGLVFSWPEYWELVVEVGEDGSIIKPAEATLLESLYNGVFDWMKNASPLDWLKALAIGAGIIWAGSKILDHFTDNGTDPNTDSQFPGGTPTTPGVITTPNPDGTGPREDPPGGITDPGYTGDPNDPNDYGGTDTGNVGSGWTGGKSALYGTSLRIVVQSLCDEAQLASYDVRRLSNTTPCNFILGQSTSIRTILENLSRAYLFDMVDSAGTLKFLPRTNKSIKTLTYEDMGFNNTNESVSPVTMKRLQSVDLPRSVSLTYVAEDLAYNNFSQKSEIATFSEGNDISLVVPFMMSHHDAKEATDRLLIGAHLERMQYTFKISYQSGMALEPGDIVSIPDAVVRIVQIEEIDEGILEVHCVDAGAVGDPTPIVVGGVTIGYTASTYIGTGLEPQLPQPTVNQAPVISKTGMLFLDPPSLSSSDTNPRAYAIIHGYGQAGWTGAQIFKSIDGGGTYNLIGQQTSSSTWGLVGTPIGAGSTYVWDNTTVITVQLKTNTLMSKTDVAVLAGENLCMVGQECIAFGVATLVSPGTYQLSHLLRGRRGTEFAVNIHEVNELFVLLDNSLFTLPTTDSDRGKLFKYKAVTIGSDLTKVDAIDLQIYGNNTIPWTAGRVSGAKSANVWNLTWLERPRFVNTLMDYNEIPHDYDYGGFAVLIYNGATIVRQTIVYDQKWTYTEAMQMTDFGAVQTALKFGVVQMSNKYGGGRSTIVNI